MRRKLNSTLATVLVVAAFAAGCSKKETPPPAPQANKPALPGKPAAPQQVQKPLSSATQAPARMDFSKRVDPFKAYAPAPPPTPVAAPQGGGAPAADVLPIQSFELAKFKVVGIIAGLNENKALVVDPNGKGYVVQVGMQIGNANGRVTKITPSGIEVVERYKEGSGRVKQRKTVLTLAKKR